MVHWERMGLMTITTSNKNEINDNNICKIKFSPTKFRAVENLFNIADIRDVKYKINIKKHLHNVT